MSDRELTYLHAFNEGLRQIMEADPDVFVPTTRRRLCLPADRDEEIAEWLAEHPPPFVDRVASVRWPGTAEATEAIDAQPTA